MTVCMLLDMQGLRVRVGMHRLVGGIESCACHAVTCNVMQCNAVLLRGQKQQVCSCPSPRYR
jgi:hypothetical protein